MPCPFFVLAFEGARLLADGLSFLLPDEVQNALPEDDWRAHVLSEGARRLVHGSLPAWRSVQTGTHPPAITDQGRAGPWDRRIRIYPGAVAEF